MNELNGRVPARFIAAVVTGGSTNVVLCPPTTIMHVTGAVVFLNNPADMPGACYVTVDDVLLCGVFLTGGFGATIQSSPILTMDIPVYPTETIRLSCDGDFTATGQGIVWGYMTGNSSFPFAP
jgi:hypothetical protein